MSSEIPGRNTCMAAQERQQYKREGEMHKRWSKRQARDQDVKDGVTYGGARKKLME